MCILSPAVTLWHLMTENHLHRNGLVYSHFKKQTQMLVSVKTNLWLCAIQHKRMVSQLWLNGFCMYFCHYQIIFLIWSLLGLLCPCIPCLALLSLFLLLPDLTLFSSVQLAQILISAAFSEISCHLEQHPSLLESANQASCWLAFPLYLDILLNAFPSIPPLWLAK